MTNFTSEEDYKDFIRTIAADKSEKEIKDMLMDAVIGKPEQEAIRSVWSLFRILCEVHIKDFYESFSLQRKGDRENIKELG